MAYELVRVQSFPGKPSRFKCIFVCPSENDLNDFRSSTNRCIDLGYEVELVDSQLPSHHGDWSLLNMQDTDNLSVLEDRAARYWQGNNIVKPEFITLSPIRITRVL
jgi:hypothetical protein